MILLTGKKPKNKGFLLLEIMMSVAILSIGLLLVLNSFMRPIRAQELSNDYFKAGLLLEQKMFELYNSDILKGTVNGIFTDFESRFSWDMNAIESEENPFMEVNLEVLWSRQNKEQDLSISTYI